MGDEHYETKFVRNLKEDRDTVEYWREIAQIREERYEAACNARKTAESDLEDIETELQIDVDRGEGLTTTQYVASVMRQRDMARGQLTQMQNLASAMICSRCGGHTPALLHTPNYIVDGEHKGLCMSCVNEDCEQAVRERDEALKTSFERRDAYDEAIAGQAVMMEVLEYYAENASGLIAGSKVASDALANLPARAKKMLAVVGATRLLLAAVKSGVTPRLQAGVSRVLEAIRVLDEEE